jgi:hypothetical protein
MGLIVPQGVESQFSFDASYATKNENVFTKLQFTLSNWGIGPSLEVGYALPLGNSSFFSIGGMYEMRYAGTPHGSSEALILHNFGPSVSYYNTISEKFGFNVSTSYVFNFGGLPTDDVFGLFLLSAGVNLKVGGNTESPDRSNNTNYNHSQSEAVTTNDTPTAEAFSNSITFVPKQGLFSNPYYVFNGVKYPFRFGYVDLVDAIEESQSANLDKSLKEDIAKYRKEVSSKKTWYWLGFGTEIVGGIWAIFEEMKVLNGDYNYDSYGNYLGNYSNDTSFLMKKMAPGLLTMTAGAVVGIVNAIGLQEKPIEIVGTYNSNFGD